MTNQTKRALLRLADPMLGVAFYVFQALTFAWRRRARLPERPNRLLVVRLDTIGDVLLSEPAIAALKRRFPEAAIDLVCGKAGQAVLDGNPHVHEFVRYDAPWHAAWRGQRVDWLARARSLLDVLRTLRQRRYDAVLELRGDIRDIAFAALTGAPVRVGNSARGGRYLLTHDVPAHVDAHRVEWCLQLAAVLGADATPAPPALQLTAEARAAAAELLADGQPWAVLHLGAGFESKLLPARTFGEIADGLAARGYRIAVVGGREDERLVRQLVEHTAAEVLVLAGQLSLVESAAVIERSKLFVGNDSGPMHLAASVGTPIVAFFGPSEPWRYHPWGAPYRIVELDLPCRPCDHVHCVQAEYLCMTRITAAQALAAAAELEQHA